MEKQNLFDVKTKTHFINRINQLGSGSQAQWGKMNVPQMLLHCQKPFLIAEGSLKPKSNPIIKFLFGKRAKRQLLSLEPFKKNLPTFPEAVITGNPDFEKEKGALINSITTFHQKGEAGITKEQHPFFGEMTVKDWNILLTQHLDHHLGQFGV